MLVCNLDKILFMNLGLSTGCAPSSTGTAREGGEVLHSSDAPEMPLPAAVESLAGPKPITLLQPNRILFGNGSTSQFIDHLAALELHNVLVLTSAPVLVACGTVVDGLRRAGINPITCSHINAEPTVSMLEECLAIARQHSLDGVIGLGGGSAMDVAKLVAALADGNQTIAQVIGMNQLRRRSLFLACLPTTAGTGSEVSPNAILLDESSRLKKAAISPHLVPDVACVDPLLTRSVPPPVTAATGLDALTHCLEAYANLNAHPAVDLYALEGVRLIAHNLAAALRDGSDTEARANLALGSLYGGLCLGPVNTAAVHALAYPLGSEFHVAHGVSIAVLLPYVLRFNLPAAPERYAAIALALGAELGSTEMAAAEDGINRLAELVAECPIPQRISELGVPRDALPRLAKSAMTVTRLLKNNPRRVTEEDVLGIYREAYGS